jgi:hypothetical protein
MFCDSVLDEDTLFHLVLLSAQGKMRGENVFCVMGEGWC